MGNILTKNLRILNPTTNKKQAIRKKKLTKKKSEKTIPTKYLDLKKLSSDIENYIELQIKNITKHDWLSLIWKLINVKRARKTVDHLEFNNLNHMARCKETNCQISTCIRSLNYFKHLRSCNNINCLMCSLTIDKIRKRKSKGKQLKSIKNSKKKSRKQHKQYIN